MSTISSQETSDGADTRRAVPNNTAGTITNAALAQQILDAFDALFGLHPGFRPAHAKGLMCSGTFTPSAEAVKLTRAPHAKVPPTPVTVRFSNSTGLPNIPDNDPHAGPRGIAIWFHLGDHLHTDIIAHSADGFPVRTRTSWSGSEMAGRWPSQRRCPSGPRPPGQEAIPISRPIHR